MKDDEMMLYALSKEREQLHQRLMQVDRIMKKIRGGEYMNQAITTLEVIPTTESKQLEFPKQANIKVQALKIFDIVRCAAKLKDIQDEYYKLTGSNYNLRETLRTLHSSKRLLMVKEKDANRSIFWVKPEWVDNGVLLDEYKPEGFDILYKADNLEFI